MQNLPSAEAFNTHTLQPRTVKLGTFLNQSHSENPLPAFIESYALIILHQQTPQTPSLDLSNRRK